MNINKANSSKAKAAAQEIRGTSVTTVLSRMFRRMMVYVAGTIDIDDNNIDTIPVDSRHFKDQFISFGKYEQLMSDFTRDRRNCINPNKKDQSSARGNLQKEILKADMSWKVFTKGLRFLSVRSLDIQITLHHCNGRSSIHSESVNLGKPIYISNEQINYTDLFGIKTVDSPTIKRNEGILKLASQDLDRSDKNI